MEIWKDIKDYEGHYQVSSAGHIRSLNRDTTISGTKSIFKGKTLKYSLDGNGYKQLALYNKGERVRMVAHRLVASTFIPNTENKPCVNHINGIKGDNRVENLEWSTQSENIKHAFKTGLSKGSMLGRFGKDHNSSKAVIQLSKKDILIEEFESISAASRKLCVNQGNISQCCNNKLKTAGGFKWKYKE